MSNKNYNPIRIKDAEQEEIKEELPLEIQEETPAEEIQPEIKESLDVKDIVGDKLKFGAVEALQLLLAGERVKLPEWKGQWKAVKFLYKDEVKHVIRVVFEDGKTSDTPIIEYLLRDDWELVSPDEYIN